MWRVEWEPVASKQLRKLDHSIQQSIIRYLKTRIVTDQDPCRFGEPLGDDKIGLWRYRVGDYRIVCRMEKEVLIVLVLKV